MFRSRRRQSERRLPTPATRERCGGSLLSRFRRSRRGSAGIEFAIIGPVHIALMLGMIETGMILAKTTLLDLGVSAATKYVYVGAAASGTVTRADIKNEVCKFVSKLQPDCYENLIVELTEITDFGDTPENAVQCQEAGADDDIEPTVTFRPGGSSDIMYMRICLTTNIMFPGVGAGLALTKTTEGNYEIVSSTAFVNEPF